MMGHTHALSGFAAAAATLPWAPVHGATAQIGWLAVWGGMAMLPDLDHPRSTVARMWGPFTSTPARAIGILARGHRGGTHDALVAPLIFGALAAGAAHYPASRLLVLALAIGLALRACAFAIPGRTESTAVGNAVLSWGAAWLLIHHGAGGPAWLPLAVAGGVLVHIAGDALTDHGVPVPLTWISQRRRFGLDLFTTGSLVETVGIALGLVVLTAWQIWVNSSAPVVLCPAVNAVRALA